MRGLQWSREVFCDSEETENTRWLQAPSIAALLILLPGVQFSFFSFVEETGEERIWEKHREIMLKGLVAPKVPLSGTFPVLSQSLE